MAYGKKYVKKTTTKYVKKTKPSGSGMSTQLATLSRQVAKLNAVAINRIQYGQTQSFSASTVLGLDSYQALPLLQFAGWNRVFGTDADDETNKQCVIKSQKCTWVFNTTEPDNRRYVMFVVSLKDDASQLLNAGTGNLEPLVQGTHYNQSNDLTLLNLNFFRIHYMKRFHSGVVPMQKLGPPVLQNIPNMGSDATKQGSWNLKFGTKGMRVKNPAGDWKAGGYPKDPSSNYFVLTFWLGDSSVDAETPVFNFHTLTQVDVSA